MHGTLSGLQNLTLGSIEQIGQAVDYFCYLHKNWRIDQVCTKETIQRWRSKRRLICVPSHDQTNAFSRLCRTDITQVSVQRKETQRCEPFSCESINHCFRCLVLQKAVISVCATSICKIKFNISDLNGRDTFHPVFTPQIPS